MPARRECRSIECFCDLQDAAVPETAIIHGIPACFLPSSLVEELSQERRPFDLYIASVVPNQLDVWRNRCPYAKVRKDT